MSTRDMVLASWRAAQRQETPRPAMTVPSVVGAVLDASGGKVAFAKAFLRRAFEALDRIEAEETDATEDTQRPAAAGARR